MEHSPSGPNEEQREDNPAYHNLPVTVPRLHAKIEYRRWLYETGGVEDMTQREAVADDLPPTNPSAIDPKKDVEQGKYL